MNTFEAQSNNNNYIHINADFSTFNIMPKKQRSLTSTAIEVAIHNDIRFPKTNPGADYDSVWSSNSTASDLYRIIRSWESAILFAAREGWVNSIAPRCKHNLCQVKNTTSYLYKRKECIWDKRRLSPMDGQYFFHRCGSMNNM